MNLDMELREIIKRVVLSTEPWGIPFCNGKDEEKVLFILTLKDLWLRKFDMNDGRLPPRPKFLSSVRMLNLHEVSYALDKSREVAIKCWREWKED